MKLLININCLNEEQTLPQVLESIPKSIPGISEIIVHVVDDGSTDKTAAVARSFGVKLVQHKNNRGLGRAFKTASETAISYGCDIFVNTDGDNQYPSSYIPKLIQPILDAQADIVIGNRQPWMIKHFSPTKRFFQWIGNFFVNQLIGLQVPDTISGFRAFSAYALMKLNPLTGFSYTLDTIIQAARKGLRIKSVPITINEPTRPSRLYSNIFQYILRSSANILWTFIVYEPFKTFNFAAFVFLTPALILLIRFLFFYLDGQGNGHIQSLVISTIGFSLSGLLFSLGVIAKLVSFNRDLIEEMLFQDKQRRWNEARSTQRKTSQN